MLSLGTFSVFSLTTWMFVNSVALKTYFTSKWAGSDIVKENFLVTQTQCVMGDYSSPEQSIWPRLWEIRSHTQNAILSYPLLMGKYLRIKKHFLFKEGSHVHAGPDWYPVYFSWPGSDRLLRRIIITHHTLCLCDWGNPCPLPV